MYPNVIWYTREKNTIFTKQFCRPFFNTILSFFLSQPNIEKSVHISSFKGADKWKDWITNTIELLEVKSVDRKWVGDKVPRIGLPFHWSVDKMINVLAEMFEHFQDVTEKVVRDLNLK